METPSVLFAYFTPDVAFPIASVVAAALGFIMLVGRAPVRLAMKGCRKIAAGFRWLVDKLQL